MARKYDWDSRTENSLLERGDHLILVGNKQFWRAEAIRHLTVVPSGVETLCVVRTCDVDDCVSHVEAIPVARPEYPAGVCVYCGLPGYTKDHLWPRNWTGEAQRRQTPVVPCCGECNALLGDVLTSDVVERREVLQERLRRKRYRDLAVVDMSPDELAEMGPRLRASYYEARNRRDVLHMRLNWPDDPFYDERAYKSLSLEVRDGSTATSDRSQAA